MDKEVESRLKSYFVRSKSKCFALKDWIALKNKKFTFLDALTCIYLFAEGNFNVMDDIIAHLTDKKKTYGRTQVYADEAHDKMDILRNGNGELELTGYNPNDPLVAKGQKMANNPKIYRKSDDQVSKTYQNAVERMGKLGAEVREMYPYYSNVELTHAMQAIRKYAIERKLNPLKITQFIKDGKLVYDKETETLGFPANEGVEYDHVIVITEEAARELGEKMEMTEYKFNETVKTFLHDLLVDPVNATPAAVLQCNGLGRHKLIGLLTGNDMLRKEQKIIDKDENGEDKPATMRVRFKVPKKNFDRKLRNLYIKLFERNVPPREASGATVNEEGEGGATSALSSGQYSQPAFPMNRREMYGEVEEDTATFNVGTYQYDVPFMGDKETLARKNGIGGSISINKS